MKVEGRFKKMESIPRFGDLKSGECFMMYGTENLFMKTDEDGAVNLNNGELVSFVNQNEPIVPVNASVKSENSNDDDFDAITTANGGHTKYFYRDIYNNSIVIPLAILKHLKISQNDKFKIAVRGNDIIITKNTAAE